MRHLIVTSLLASLIVLGLSHGASAAGFRNAGGLNGGSFQGVSFNGSACQGTGFNGASFQGRGFNSGGFQGKSLNGPAFQGNGFNGRSTQGNGLDANAVPGDASGRHIDPTNDTSGEVKIGVNVPRHGLRLNGVILADPSPSTD